MHPNRDLVAWEHFPPARVSLTSLSHCVTGERPMFPLLAMTYTAARLGFEAQSAAAFRLLRLGAGIAKAADTIVPEPPVRFADVAPAPISAKPTRRPATKK